MLEFGHAMSFVDTSKLDVIERKPGWHGRYFHSPNMTFAHYEFKRFHDVRLAGVVLPQKHNGLVPREINLDRSTDRTVVSDSESFDPSDSPAP